MTNEGAVEEKTLDADKLSAEARAFAYQGLDLDAVPEDVKAEVRKALVVINRAAGVLLRAGVNWTAPRSKARDQVVKSHGQICDGFVGFNLMYDMNLVGHWSRCEADNRTASYSYRNWSKVFRCPKCGRSGKFNLNFLGDRVVVCDGKKFHKVSRELVPAAVAEGKV